MSIQAEIIGGLGNQLFIVAALLGASKKQNIPYHLEKVDTECHSNRPTYWDILFHKLNFASFRPNVDYIYNEQQLNIYNPIPATNGKNIKIKGYFQSTKYFSGQEKELFTLKPEVEKIVDQKFNYFKTGYPEDIKVNSIHVRRGDYFKYPDTFYIVEIEWYKRALQHFDLDKDLFLIFSEDIEWCKHNFSFIKNKRFVHGDVDYIDMFMMSKCDGAIVPNSTFSWWGAYLGKEKKVVCVDPWFRDNMSQKEMRIENNWIIVPLFADTISSTVKLNNNSVLSSTSISSNPQNESFTGTTLITGFFSLSGKRPTGVEEYMTLGKKLLNFNHNMIIFTDYDSYHLIWKFRNEANLLHKTFFIPMNLSDFSLYHLKQKLIPLFEKEPSDKHTVDYSILTNSKMEMMYKSSMINPFNTSHFTWIDFGIAKFGEMTNTHQLNVLVNSYKEKFSLMQLNYVSKNLIQPGQSHHKNKGSAYAAGCLSGTKSYITKIWELFKVYYQNAVNEGYLCVEEHIFKEIIIDYPQYFDIYYGAYYSVIANFSQIIYHGENIIENIIIKARENRDYNTSYKVCNLLYSAWETNKSTLNPYYTLKLLDEYFISSWHTNNKNNCVEIVKKVQILLHKDIIAREFNRRIDHLTTNFDYVNGLLPKQKNIYCLERPSGDVLQKLTQEGKVHIYSQDENILPNYMLTSNPVIRPYNRIFDVNYDQKIVNFNFNEHNSFCISLRTQEDRYKRMLTRFKNNNINITRWIASTPDNIIDKFDKRLSKFEKACAQSYINVWRHQIKNKLPYVFILEDDACFDKDWKKKLAEIDLSPKWDAIFLNASDKTDKSFCWSKARDQLLTAGYILSYKGAKKLISTYEQTMFYSADLMTSLLQKDDDCYVYFPWLIIQECKESSLRSQDDVDQVYNKMCNILKDIDYSLNNYDINVEESEFENKYIIDLTSQSEETEKVVKSSIQKLIKFEFTKDNTFCVSLLSREDRWSRMERRFKKEQLDVTRWIASTPKDLVDKFREHLRPSERACAQSHINVWRHQIEHNLPYVFILEDDACFDSKWRKKLNEIIDDIKDKEWDIIMLNAAGPNKSNYKWEINRGQYYTGGYIISLEGAKYILETFNNNFITSDGMTMELQNRGKGYVYFPWLIIQENSDSDIGHVVDDEFKYISTRLKDISYSLDNYDI